jgi:S1-C subfamily serine protease
MLLPGSGLGIDSVAAGSPAEGAGLQPGMVIASMNGVALNSESDLERAMSTSNGVLDLQIVTGANQAPTAIRVQMVLVTSISR